MKTAWNIEAFTLAFHHSLTLPIGQAPAAARRRNLTLAKAAFPLLRAGRSHARAISLYRLFFEHRLAAAPQIMGKIAETQGTTARYALLLEHIIRLYLWRYETSQTDISLSSPASLYRLAHQDAAIFLSFAAQQPEGVFFPPAYAASLGVPRDHAETLFWTVDSLFAYASALMHQPVTPISATSSLPQRYVVEAAYAQLMPLVSALLRRLSRLYPSPALLRETLRDALLPLAADYQALAADVTSPLTLPPFPDMEMARMLESIETHYLTRDSHSSTLLSSLQHAIEDHSFSAAARYQAILPQLSEAQTAPSLSLADKIGNDAGSVAKEAGRAILSFFKNLQKAQAAPPEQAAAIAPPHTATRRSLDTHPMRYEVSVAGEKWHAAVLADIEQHLQLGRRVIFMTHHQAHSFIKASLYSHQQQKKTPGFELGLVHYVQKGQIIPFSHTANPLSSESLLLG